MTYDLNNMGIPYVDNSDRWEGFIGLRQTPSCLSSSDIAQQKLAYCTPILCTGNPLHMGCAITYDKNLVKTFGLLTSFTNSVVQSGQHAFLVSIILVLVLFIITIHLTCQMSSWP